MADRLPEWAQGTAKNLLVTKDSATYLALNRATQYGDFVAKAVLYDHLTKRRKKCQDEALDTSMEEFVQYNRLAGRGRDYLESMGMLWFWNYKLRIAKVLMNALRDRPLNALMTLTQTGPHLGIDTVWDGSVWGNMADGSVWFSMGPQMGIQAPSLHPLVAVFD